MSLNERKEQILEDINLETVTGIEALNQQQNELLNLHAQMSGYLELIEIKLKSERDRDIVAMKDQMVSRGVSLSNAVKFTRSSPIKTVPPKVEFPRLQNVLDFAKVLGVSFSYETCRVVEITESSKEPTFQVTVKDSLGQPISNCASLLNVKIILNKDAYDKLDYFKKKQTKDIEIPKVIHKGNGNYEFSTTCDNAVQAIVTPKRMGDEIVLYKQGWANPKMQQKYGLVCVQLFGKDVPGSPLT